VANYNETVGTGTMWTRCHKIVIENPYLGLEKVIKFFEENVVTINNKIIVKESSTVKNSFNPNSTINILDPETGQSTGETITHQELYNILYSLYIQSALERDTQQQ